MNDTCGCCGETANGTAEAIGGRPGLDAIHYRVGTHGSFLAAMLARLSSAEHPDVHALTTREASDPAIALLDAWACVADVLTFYQERIANEGYLRTATERRSVLELARLIGYQLRPGVAASTFLAFIVENTVKDKVIIPIGTRAQSVPGPERLKPQPFETGEPLKATAGWSTMHPLQSRGQTLSELFDAGPLFGPKGPIYVKGALTNLLPGTPIVVDFGNPKQIYRLGAVAPDAAAQRTRIDLRPWVPPAQVAMAVQPLAGVGTVTRLPLPPMMGATSLRTAMSFTSEASRTPQERLIMLVHAAAEGLLTALEALAAAPPSSETNRAVDEALTSLRALRDAVEQLDQSINRSLFASAVEQLKAWLDQAIAALEGRVTTAPSAPLVALSDIVTRLSESPLVALAPLRHPAYLSLNLASVFAHRSTQLKQLQIALLPQLAALPQALNGVVRSGGGAALPQTLSATAGAGGGPVALYAMRLRVAPFGRNIPDQIIFKPPPAQPEIKPWPLLLAPATNNDREQPNVLFLDNAYEAIVPGQFVAILVPGTTTPKMFEVESATVRARTAYGVTAPTTELRLKGNWWNPTATTSFATLSGTVVYAQSEPLALALAPDDSPLAKGDETIDLDVVYDFLETGRRLVVAGEREDLRGVMASELVILAAAEELPPALPGESYHTRLLLQSPLQFSYRRATATIYGNVVPATHGETRREVLGSGDASVSLQRFTLRQSPLTYLAAPTAVGAESTLELRVDNVLWHEAPRLAGLEPTDRRYILRTDDEQKTTAIFGSGEHGARLPTGAENVRAVYRTGIGKVGNVPTERITLLATRPFGIKAVTNPLASTGGADRESRDQARRNAPLAVMSLDRLVSVPDYADFARTFAGIGKAEATPLSDGAQRLVHLTIAGADDIPIAKTSELYLNLVEALRRQGDPYQPFIVEPRELVALFISARVRIHPDYLWEKVKEQIRLRLTDQFSFDRRELAQDVTLGEVIGAIQAVAGVTFVDMDLLAGIDETTASNTTALTARLSALVGGIDQATSRPDPRVRAELGRPNPTPTPDTPELLPAQLVYLLPEVPELLHLELLP